MREIQASLITEIVKDLVMDAEYNLPEDFIHAIEKSVDKEESPIGKEILNEILKMPRSHLKRR